jgi:hypothetical protein
MASRFKGLALSSVFALALGFAFMPLGCGSSGRGPAHGDAEVPEGVALRFRTCAVEHRTHLRPAEHSIRFDVKLANDGQVDSVALKDSTLGDQDLEDCMAGALRSLSVDDLPMRRSESRPRGPVAPESRAVFGHAEAALACLASPPCLLALTFLIGAAYITVQIYLHASSTAETTTTAVPLPDVDCKKVKNECIDKCYKTALPTRDFGNTYSKCMRECLEASNCW